LEAEGFAGIGGWRRILALPDEGVAEVLWVGRLRLEAELAWLLVSRLVGLPSCRGRVAEVVAGLGVTRVLRRMPLVLRMPPQAGQINDAILQYQQALRLQPNDALTHNNLGSALGMNGQIDDAIPNSSKPSASKPDDAALKTTWPGPWK